MAPPKNTEARRAQIVDAFLSVMAERGYDGASMAIVAKEAGLNQGLIHYHFKGKAAVLLQALDTLANAHAARLDAAFAEAGDPLAQIAAFIDVHVGLGAHADPRALACWVAMGAEATRQPAVRIAYAAAVDGLTGRLVQALTEAKDAGLIAHPEPKSAAMALYAVTQGYFELGAAAPDCIPPGSAAPSVRAMANGLLEPVRLFGAAL